MHDSSKVLVELLRVGDQEAAEAIFDRYVARLIALARSRLSARLSRRVDPEDVVQSAFRSFFRRAGAGDYDLSDAGDLWRLLTVITLNKLRRKAEYHSADKRNYAAELTPKTDENGRELYEAVSGGPSPQAELEVAEEIAVVTQGFSDEHIRMIELRLQGHKLEEIAADLDVSERTVRRVLDRFRTRLEQRLAALDPPQ